MAININRIYQTVLALANKEQRGYITPQEFNLFAHQAQMSIFEQYFYDVQQFKRLPKDQEEHLDAVRNLENKIEAFMTTESLGSPTAGSTESYGNSYFAGGVTLPSDLYRINQIIGGTGSGNVEIVSSRKFTQAMASYLTRPKFTRPICYIRGNVLFVSPSVDITISYIREPKHPKWSYIVVGDKPIYNPDVNAGAQDFELNASEENKLVLKILQLAGVAIEDFALTQAAGAAEVNTVAQQKQ